jgi:hypothetical protein
MPSKAATVKDYLAGLPADRREVIEAVREVIVANLDEGYEEGMQYGMLGYYVPHRVFPDGYHCDPKQPLPFLSVASTKTHIALHMFCVYGDDGLHAWFRDAWSKTGKKLDMGAACVRVKKLEDIALDVVGEVVRRLPTATYVEHYVKMRESKAGTRPSTKSQKVKAGAAKPSGAAVAAKAKGSGRAAGKSTGKSIGKAAGAKVTKKAR